MVIQNLASKWASCGRLLEFGPYSQPDSWSELREQLDHRSLIESLRVHCSGINIVRAQLTENFLKLSRSELIDQAFGRRNCLHPFRRCTRSGARRGRLGVQRNEPAKNRDPN